MNARMEIKAAIKFYEFNGWNWLSVVEFLARQANNALRNCPEGYVMYPRRGRPRKQR